MSFPYIIQGQNVTVVIDGTPHTISKSHVTYQKVVDAIKTADWATVKQLIDPVKVVLNYGQGNVSIQGDRLFWKGEPFAGVMAARMVQMLQEGFSINPMVLFMERLMKNPSKRSVDELYGFLEKNNLPITPDGYFLAYKKVRFDFKDIHSGTMDNSPGQIVEMERNQVDDDKDRTCSTGLHFCGLGYLDHFGGSDSRTVIVKIDPADVVSIPSDYDGAKGRTCRYEVIGELGVSPEDAFDKPVQSTANGSKTDEFDEFDDSTNGAFYRGYIDGYTGRAYDHSDYQSEFDQDDYCDGYDEGQGDLIDGLQSRYQAVDDSRPTDDSNQDPRVAGLAQEYDRNGRPLSMTWNAVRKRRARAAAKNKSA